MNCFVDKECRENICRSLVDSHERYCVWKFMIIPESIVQLTDIYSNETINKFLQEAEEFLLKIKQIDIVGQLKTVCLVNKIDLNIFLFFRYFKLKQQISIFYQVHI